MNEEHEDSSVTHSAEVYLKRISRDMRELLHLNREMVKFMRDAETEVPESLRRFGNYFHDLHDIRYMYHEEGQPCPHHIDRELERLHDRYRQILAELNLDENAIGKIRAAMAADPHNRYDHTRQLPKPTHLNGEQK